MVKLVLLAFLFLLVVSVIVPICMLTKARQIKHVSNISSLGTLLFSHANEKDGVYPKSLEDLVTAKIITKEKLDQMIGEGKVTYFDQNATTGSSDTDPLIIVSYPDGDVILYKGNNAEFKKRAP
jgi:hypothetical protein